MTQDHPTNKIPPPRQRQVVDLASQGKTDREIAADLGISKRTVEEHWKRFYSSTGAKSRPHAVRMGIEEGWLD